MSRRLLVALAVAGFVLIGLATALVQFAHDFQPADAGEGLGRVVYAGIWIATGLVAWQRRPGNRVGLLMVALGFAVASGQLYWDASVPYVFFTALGSLQILIFVHLFLAFPSGRLETSLERRFVACVYGAWLVLAPLWVLMSGPAPRRRVPGVSHESVSCRWLRHRCAGLSSGRKHAHRRSLRCHRRPARAQGASRERGDPPRGRPRALDERDRDSPVRPAT